MIALKHIISIARNTGQLPFNPFAGYINSPGNVDRGELAKGKLNALVNAKMKNAQYELARDLFVFSTFTELSGKHGQNDHPKLAFSTHKKSTHISVSA